MDIYANGSIWDGEGEENFGFTHTYQSGVELPSKRDIFLFFPGYYCLSFLEQPQIICQHIFFVKGSHEGRIILNFVRMGFV